MMKFILSATLLFISFTAAAQQKNNFPQNFIGNWKGTLQWMVADKPTQTFTMQLRIQPVDTAKGYWVVDERNGIILGSYIFGNCLQGAFTVQENTIVDNYCVDGDGMQVEFFNIKLADKKQSGKGNDEVPFVDSYRMGGYQKGVLKRMK